MKALEVLLEASLVIFMVGNLLDMGLRLNMSEALRGFRDGRFVVASLLWGFVLLPALAYALAEVLPMAHPFAMGLVLLGMAPCAPFLPPMVDRAHGDMGLAAAFMLLASVVTVAYMPVAVPLMVKGLSASAWTIAKPLVLFLLVPLAIGLALQRRSAALAGRLHPFVKKATGVDTILMLLLCVAVYGKEFLELVGSRGLRQGVPRAGRQSRHRRAGPVLCRGHARAVLAEHRTASRAENRDFARHGHPQPRRGVRPAVRHSGHRSARHCHGRFRRAHAVHVFVRRSDFLWPPRCKGSVALVPIVADARLRNHG